MLEFVKFRSCADVIQRVAADDGAIYRDILMLEFVIFSSCSLYFAESFAGSNLARIEPAK